MSYSADTRIIPVDAEAPDAASIAQAAGVIQRGGLVAFPTETVYGLGANALDSAAVDRIYAAKGRPATDPLIVHVASAAELTAVADNIPTLAWQLADAFWPGPLTLVLLRSASVAPNVAAGSDTVAVRMPRHPVALALIRAAQRPVAAPSANLFARPSPTTARHVLDDLSGRVDIVLDGGPTPIGVESTVLDLTTAPARVLRPGGVTLEQLRALLPDVDYTARYLAEAETAAAPGMLLKHYAPQAELVVLDGPPQAAAQGIHDRALAAINAGRRVGVLAVEDDLAFFAGLPVAVESLGREDNISDAAQRLFAALRSLDARGVDVIFARSSGREGLGLAVWDRLVRAAEGRIITVK